MSILKQLKKILRRYRGLISIGIILFAIVGALTFDNLSSHIIHPGSNQEEAIDVIAKQPVKLILKTNYICGTEIGIKQFHQVKEIEEWLEAQKSSWTIESKKESEYIISRTVLNDLSPLCKQEGYFGISKEGVLTMFQGPPTDNHVIQTFFRIDTQLLESKLPKEKIGSLKQGIRVHNVDEYLHVLSTFEEFATEY